MNSKKIITVFLFAMLTATVIPAFAGEPVKGLTTENVNKIAHTQQVVNRLTEIRSMDKAILLHQKSES